MTAAGERSPLAVPVPPAPPAAPAVPPVPPSSAATPPPAPPPAPAAPPPTSSAAPATPTEGAAPTRPAGTRCTHLRTDGRGVVLSVDGAFRKILGWEPSEIVGRRIGELVHRDDLQQGLSSWAKLLKTPGATGEGLRLRYQHRDGRWVWLDVVHRNRLPEDIESEMVDVTAEVAALDELRIRDQLLAQLTDSVPVGLFHVDTEGRLLYVNPQLAEMTSVAGAKTLGEQLTGLAD